MQTAKRAPAPVSSAEPIVGILLAAGSGRRYGGDKLMQPLADGVPLACRAARVLASACNRTLAVVAAGSAPALESALRELGVEVVVAADASRGMGHTLLGGVMAFGVVLVAFSFSRQLWLTQALLFLGGALLVSTFSTVTSLVQLIAPNEMRGRVMSIYMLAFRGGMPLGSLASGWAATYIGAPAVLQINGVLLVAVAIYFLIRSHGVREI